MIPVYVVSLPGSERRDLIQSQLDRLEIPFRFFDAVNGGLLSSDCLRSAAPRGGMDYSGLMTPGEIGAALSHLSLLRLISESEHEYTAVFEDDVFVLDEAKTLLDEKLLHLLAPFDVLQLGKPTKKPRLVLKVGGISRYEAYASPRFRFHMAGLIYSRNAARLICASIKTITAPIDNMIFHNRCPFGLRLVQLQPPVIGGNSHLESEIGSRDRPTPLSFKLDREIRRCRNWARSWCSFGYRWGILGLMGLRAPDFE